MASPLPHWSGDGPCGYPPGVFPQARKEAERARKQRGKGGVRDGHGLQGRGANLVPEVKAVRREMEGKRGR